MAANEIKPPAYVIAEIEITDPATYEPYRVGTPETLAPFGAQYFVRGGAIIPLEGEPPKRFVVIGFDSLEKAQAWYSSPSYEAIRPLRLRSTKSRVFIAEGLAPKQ